MKEEKLNYALEKNLIDNESKIAIQEYDARLTQNQVPIIYNLRHIRKIFSIKKKEQEKYFGKERKKMYHTFCIPKKSGKYRVIEAPVDDLKAIQTWIKRNILDRFDVSPFAKGFVRNESILDNALPHVNKDLVICLDLKDFFPSIKYNKVFKIFNYIGYTKEVSHELTKLCTNYKNELPQGSPASPVLSNLVCLKLDSRISKLGEKYKFSYTRYADDITISGHKSIRNALPIIYEIIREEGFVVNEEKTRFQYKYQRQEVTGLLVNNKVSITKGLKRELENAIYYCGKYGVASHMNKIECDRAYYKEHLFGIAYFIHMINPEQGNSYIEKLNRIEWSY